MANKNASLDENQWYSEDILDSFDFDELEDKLQSQLEEEFGELEFLADEKEKIGNSDHLGNVIMDVIWEQFTNQVAVVAGEDFIRDNNGLKLDLRDEAHIQTTDNFEKGKIATHNTEIDYKKRYDDWQSNFQRNEDGSIKTRVDNRTGEEKAVLRKEDKKKDPEGKNYNSNFDAREYIDKDRPKGSKSVHKDHTVSAAEIIRDAEANAHMGREEQAAFANSDKNLVDLDSRANQSKGDSKMTDWLESEKNGEKPADRYPINEEELRTRDKEAREELEKNKKEGEQKSIDTGKQSQKEEAFRIGGKALRAVIMQLLADLVKEIIAKLVKWFKSTKKDIHTLLDRLKEAIHAFISKMRTHLINAGNTVFSTVATAIIGPVFGTIKKVCMLLKHGWKSLKDAVNYIKSPENKGKPINRIILETGKIIIAGLTGAGALVLGEVIEKGLMTIPIFAIEIPLIGSLANILGIFFGAVVAGIIGAIAINIIGKRIEKSQKVNAVMNQVNKSNEVLNLQHQVRIVSEVKLEHTKANAMNDIKERHVVAEDMMSESLKNIVANCDDDESIQNTFDDIDNLFDELE